VTHEESGLELHSVWGETVAIRNLTVALLISSPATIVGFLIARSILDSTMDDEALARTYSLLAGLFVAVSCAALCSVLFKPQRVVTTDDAADSSTFDQALAEIAAEEGGLGRVSDLPLEVQAEMRSLGLYDAFERAEREAAPAAAESSATAPSTRLPKGDVS
jgi:hypothetical protein